MLILPRESGRQQPSGASGLNRQNPLAAGVAFAWTPLHGLRDPVGGYSIAHYAGTIAPALVGLPAGLALAYTRDGFNDNHSTVSGVSETYSLGCTWMVSGRLTDASTSRSGVLAWTNGSLYFVSGGLRLTKSSSLRLTTTNTIAAGSDFVIIGQTIDGGTNSLILNGVLSSAADGGFGNATSPTEIGGESGSGSGGVSLTNLVMWRRLLSLGEMQSLSDNPWQVYEPPRRIWKFESPPTPPSISSHPTSINVVNGQPAAFTVGAAGTGLTYQWQDNSSGSFADIGGATSASYTTAATTSLFQRRQYRCVVNGTVTSNAATLTLSWHDVYLRSVPSDADPDDVRLYDPTVFDTGGVTTSSAVSAGSSQGASGVNATASQAAVSQGAGQAASPVNATAAQAAVSQGAGQATAAARMGAAATSQGGSQASAPTVSPAVAASAGAGQAASPTAMLAGAASQGASQASAPTAMVSAAASQAAAQATSDVVDATSGGGTLTSSAVSAGAGQAAAPTVSPATAVSQAAAQANSPTASPAAAVSSGVGQASSPTVMQAGAVSQSTAQASAPTASPASAVSQGTGQAASGAGDAAGPTTVSAVSAGAGQAVAPLFVEAPTPPVVEVPAGGGGTRTSVARHSSWQSGFPREERAQAKKPTWRKDDEMILAAIMAAVVELEEA